MNQSHHQVNDAPGNTPGPLAAADLPIDDQGRLYHLQVKPGQIAPDILIVGDPGRAEMIGSTFLKDIEFEHEHRGLVTVTGIAEVTGKPATIVTPLRATAATSGIGTLSLEIVIGELVALHEIDLETRTRKGDVPRLHVIRVGTSGGLQASTRLGTGIITSYALGLDNAAMYYEAPYADETCRRLEQELAVLIKSAMAPDSRFYGRIRPTVSRAAPQIVRAMARAAEHLGVPARVGLTASASGFFAAQGRDVFRLSPTVPDLDAHLADYDPRLEGQRIENMEMEASFLLHFLGGLGHWAGAICAAIANRRQDTIDVNYQEAIKNATRVALVALATLRSRYPDARIGAT